MEWRTPDEHLPWSGSGIDRKQGKPALGGIRNGVWHLLGRPMVGAWMHKF